MKFFTTFLLLVFSVFAVNAQGNMQFNQVVRTKFTGISSNSGYFTTVGTISVPQNKVWKIESGSMIYDYYISNSNKDELLVDGQLLYYFMGIDIPISGGSNSTNAPVVFNSAPIWLPSGNYPIAFRSIFSSSPGTSFTITISALEFNIVP